MARPKKKTRLKMSAKKFAKTLLATGSPAIAAEASGYCAGYGGRLVEIPEIKKEIVKVLEKAGLGTERLVEEIKKGLENGNLASHEKYLEMALKVHGFLKNNSDLVQVQTQNNLYQIIIQARMERGLPIDGVTIPGKCNTIDIVPPVAGDENKNEIEGEK